MSNKSLTYGLVVVAVIAIISLFFGHKTIQTVVRQGAASSPTTNLPSIGVQNLSIGTGCDQSYTSSTCIGTGALSGNFNLNGVISTSTRVAMTNATSTLCAIQSPAATSTLVLFTAFVSSSTAVTSTTFVLATSTTAFATTSLITRFGTANSFVAAGAQASLTWGVGDTNAIVAPSTFVVLGVQGGLGTFGTAAQVGGGSCQAVFVGV